MNLDRISNILRKKREAAMNERPANEHVEEDHRAVAAGFDKTPSPLVAFEALPTTAQQHIDHVEGLRDERTRLREQIKVLEEDLVHMDEAYRIATGHRRLDDLMVDCADDADHVLSVAEFAELREEILRQLG